MTENKRVEALRRLSETLLAAVEDPAQLAALSQLLDYEQGQLRSDAGELSGTVEALENGSLYQFDDIDIDDIDIDFEGVEGLELQNIDDLPQFEI